MNAISEQPQTVDAMRLVRAIAVQAWRRSKRRVDLDELVSIGSLVFVCAQREHRPELSRFGAYLVSRLRWAMVDELRRSFRRARMSTGEDDAGHEDPALYDPVVRVTAADLLERQEEEAALQDGLEELAPAERALLDARYQREERLDVAARGLRMSRATAWKTQRVAMRRLRERIENPRRRPFRRCEP